MYFKDTKKLNNSYDAVILFCDYTSRNCMMEYDQDE